MILNDFLKALGQLGDRRFLGVMAKGVGLTILLLAAVTVATLWGLGWLLPDQFTLAGITIKWVDNLVSWAFVGIMLLASVFLMVPVASLFTGFFLEEVADAVEDRHYPHLPSVTPVPIGDTVRDSIGFFGVLIVMNLIAVALALVFLPVAIFIFWAINGFLLGREYYQMVAMRRLGRDGANADRKQNWLTVWIAGILMAAPLSVPLINLVVPVLGVATFTHLFHRLQRQSPVQTV
ncbi:MAG: EI24 domain-containing protein [Pseudomonadota bacterium]